MTQESTMQFPFETTTKDGQKATVLGTMPDGRLAGYIKLEGGFSPWCWSADGSEPACGMSITLPLQIKPLTTYRMRNGRIAWTTGLISAGRIFGMSDDGFHWSWIISNGRWIEFAENHADLIEELPPGTTA